METIKKNYKTLLLLQLLLAFYSLSSVCSKMAAQEEFLSIKFIMFYGAVILFLGIYAVVWQQILKKLPLVMAYMNKAVTVIWGMIWGVIFFNERITINKIFGCIIIVVGVCLVVAEKEDKECI